jgi:hypothetical protein
MSEPKKKTPAFPKPWRLRVKRRKLAKFRKRIHWTGARWRKYFDAREARRAQPKRPHLMALRLRNQAQMRDSQARSQRMRAYHARRRASEAAEYDP